MLLSSPDAEAEVLTHSNLAAGPEWPFPPSLLTLAFSYR